MENSTSTIETPEHCWETTERTTRSPESPIDGIDVLALLKLSTSTSIALIFNFRPPIKTYSIEFPSGILDKSETPELCALRELEEETGLYGKVIKTYKQPLYNSPWSTNECSYLVQVEIDCNDDRNKNPISKLEQDENIELLIIPLNELFDTLSEILNQHKNIQIDAKVWTFALGLNNKL